MWYGTGTIQVAANGTTATGTGTQFIGNARVGDGIAIQGSATLHEVTGVTSNTQLSFSPPYAGTAGSGKAFRIVPVLGYDKDLSDAFNALRHQFGDQLSNLQPWATAPTQDAAQTALGMSATGKAVAKGTPAQGRTALGLGSAASRDVGTDTNNVMQVGAFGLGRSGTDIPQEANLNDYIRNGFYRTDTNAVAASVLNSPVSSAFGLTVLPVGAYSSTSSFQILKPFSSRSIWTRYANNGAWSDWMELLHTGNTTVDANGFLKNASPIIKLHSDRIESNNDEAPSFDRIDTGHYQLTGTNGLRLTDGWYIETPHDKNGNKYFNVEWEQDHEPDAEAGVLEEPADVTLTIRCYERVWNPATGQHENGDPVDIPDGRWIDLRMNEVRQPEPEEMVEEPEAPQQPSEPGAPIVPHVVTKAQGKTALIQTGLWQAVADYVAAIEDETERMLAEVALHDAQDYRRDSPFLNAAADALGITEEQKDDLFILASSIVL